MIKYFDGGMGTMLNLKAGELPELLNLSDPERIFAIHKAYAEAGCDIISANTFGANRLKYDNADELVRAAVQNARRTGKKVALDIGPTGKRGCFGRYGQGRQRRCRPCSLRNFRRCLRTESRYACGQRKLRFATCCVYDF